MQVLIIARGLVDVARFVRGFMGYAWDFAVLADKELSQCLLS